MARKSEPNAQNSEINPQAHPSGSRIEKMMNDAEEQKAARRAGVEKPQVEKGAEPVIGSERGPGGELLRPSEREDFMDAHEGINVPAKDEPVEGGIDQFPSKGHRMNADDRESRD